MRTCSRSQGQVRSHLFFAHVRAATGTATTRANCHPFAHGRHLFMHNGQIGGYGLIRRRLEALIPDSLYSARVGTTDSEALFLLTLSRIEDGLAPGAALAAALGDALGLMREAGTAEPLRCAAALADGDTIHAVRWSSDARPPSLYLCQRSDSVVIARSLSMRRATAGRPCPATRSSRSRPGLSP